MIWIKWLLSVLGGVGVFLFGMRTLSDAIRRASATSFREFLSSITQSTWVGTMTGMFVTSLLQSSSAVTVTLVSLVNAGLLTLRESVGVLFGANIGTTITVWLIVLSLGIFLVGLGVAHRRIGGSTASDGAPAAASGGQHDDRFCLAVHRIEFAQGPNGKCRCSRAVHLHLS